MNYYQVPQGAGRYISVPYYIPVQHPVYPNYPVDPNHPHWIPAPHYGNGPIVNGRQTENDGNETDANVEDERGGGGAAGYPPPGVGLPPTSTMPQQPVYQMMPPFSNLYVGGLPSGLSVQGFSSPMYPHPYPALPPTSDLGNSPNNTGGNRSGTGNRGAGGKTAGGGGKMSVDKGSSNSADSSPYNSTGPLQQSDSNATAANNDLSAATLPPGALAPPHPHPQANLIPFGAMQYGYSYYPQPGHHPPPPHLTSAQHAAGSPLYLPHPSMYHTPIYNSGPAGAVYSTDNGIPHHPSVSVAPVTLQPITDMVSNHEVDSAAPRSSNATVGSVDSSLKVVPADEDSESIVGSAADDEPYKNSNLLAESAPYQPEKQKNSGSAFDFAAELMPPVVNAPTRVDSTENIATGSNDEGTANAAVVADNENVSSYIQNSNAVNDVSSLPVTKKRLESPSATATKTDNQMHVVDAATSVSRRSSVSRRKEENQDAAAMAIHSLDKVKVVNGPVSIATNLGSGTATIASIAAECLVNGIKAQHPLATDHAAVETASSTSELGPSEKSSSSPESVNGKSNLSESANSSGFESCISKLSLSGPEKEDTSEESSPPASAATKTWASLFKGPSSSAPKSKSSSSTIAMAAGRLSSDELSNNVATVRTYTVHNTDTSTNSSNASSVTGHSSSYNGGLSTIQSSIKSSSYRYSSSSSMSLADDTALPKIGELLKNYKLDHRAVNFEPRGLDNRSNFCYINAILQALLACPPFYNLMKCISHNLHNTKTKLASKQHFPIIDSMVQFVDEFKLISQKARRDKVRKMEPVPHQEIQPGKSFEPNSMYNVLSVIQNNSVFMMGQQEDAQEFLTCLLNGLNDEMVELIQLSDGIVNNGVNTRKMPPPPPPAVKPTMPKNNKKLSNGDIASEVNAPDDSDSEWKQVHSKIKPHRANNLALTPTPLSEIFRGQMRSRVQKVGDSATNNIEPFFTLHLNIEKASSVKDALELLVGRDALEGVTSSRTNQEVDAWQQQTLEELPFVLLLHLKYFDFKHHTCTKIMKSVEFPIDLKLDLKLISPQSTLRLKAMNSKSRQYKLFAVVYHDGKEASKGHYVTDVFHIGYGGWIRYDDSRVYTVSENDVLKPKLPRVPYLLYYRRCDTIAALMQAPFDKRQWW